MHLAFVTYADAPTLAPSDALAAHALAQRGTAVSAHPWDDPTVTWAAYDAVVLRSCWDYHRREHEFRTWLHQLDVAAVPVWNPSSLVRWNMDKRYLRDLAARGIDTIPTMYVESGSRVTLAECARALGRADLVIKPAVSGSAYRTARVTPSDDAAERAFETLCADGVALVQPFVAELQRDGEWSLLFFGGVFSHAVLKTPAPGDFRVQLEFGGTARAAIPPEAVLRQAYDVTARIDGPWLYARVDGCVVDGTFTLVELELIEPVLFLDAAPEAPTRFADAVRQAVHHGLAPGA